MKLANAYLDAVFQGKNAWWRYVLSLGILILFWLGLGSVPIIALGAWTIFDNNPATELSPTGQFLGIDPLLVFVAAMFSLVMFGAGVFIAVRLFHQRRFLSLVSPEAAISWRRLGQGFGVWLVLAALLSLVEALLYPGRYQLAFDLTKFLPFALAALLLIPLQTSAEELFFRGYLLQWMGLRLRNVLGLSVLSGAIFTLPHLGNPEVAINFWLVTLFYFFFGTFAALLTLRDGRLELALGIHAANNLFTALIANFEGSAIPTPAVFFVSELDPVYSLAGALVAMVTFYLVFFGFKQTASPNTVSLSEEN